MSQFINEKQDLVTQAIDGLLRNSIDRLARLDGYPHIKVVIRTDWDKSKVALVSGGGSGHEPSHAGFVGKGMLTAAVCGEVFASPSVDAVLAGIVAVTGDAGCLLIVKNYTGDRLNFGLAAERARALGLKVAMVVVDDDIALPDLPQPRGVAGTLFVHKIAGAMAENGASLEELEKTANEVIGETASLGLSLGTCTVPGAPSEDRIPEGKAELGLGIHGEPGVEQIDYSGAASAMQTVTKRLFADAGELPHVALLNNLGGTTPLEMSILADELCRSAAGATISHLIGPAAMMTSLDMQGFSVSLLPAREEWLAALGSEVALVAWPGLNLVGDPQVRSLPDGLQPQKFGASDDPQARRILTIGSDVLIDAENVLNALDAKSGDGDTGSTLAGAARDLKEAIDRLPLSDQTSLLRAIGTELSQTMGGSSGVLLGIFFGAAADASASGSGLSDALQAGLERVSQVGGASVGDRTMVDALAPALAILREGGLEQAAEAARTGADSTANITRAKAGRATYVSSDNLAGHNDPGAEAVALLFEALAG